jgi:PEGA domain-containing protein
MIFRSNLAVSVLVSIPCMAKASTAHAAPNPSDDAQRLASDGIQLAASGDCTNAVDRLARAEELVHAPTTAVPLGICDIQLGKIIAGTELLFRVLNETFPASAPPAWIEARRRAKSALDVAEARIAKIRIHLDRPPGALDGLQVTIDDQPMSLVLLDNDRPTDPGTHHISVKEEGYSTAEADVSLVDGQTQAITLRLEPLPPPPAAPPGTGAPVEASNVSEGRVAQISGRPPDAAMTSGSVDSSSTPGLVALCVAGAGVFVGTGFGVAALSTKSSLDSVCSGKVCPQSSQADIDTLHTDAALSTAGWGVAGAGAVAGVILLLTARGHDRVGAAHADIRPWVSPASMGLLGSFW